MFGSFQAQPFKKGYCSEHVSILTDQIYMLSIYTSGLLEKLKGMREPSSIEFPACWKF